MALLLLRGEQLQELADVYVGRGEDYAYNPRIRGQVSKQAGFDTGGIRAGDSGRKIIFCYTHRLAEWVDSPAGLPSMSDPFVLVTHNSDGNVVYDDPAVRAILAWPGLVRWYAQNVGDLHPKLVPLPIGLANTQWPHGDPGLDRVVAGQDAGNGQLAAATATFSGGGEGGDGHPAGARERNGIYACFSVGSHPSRAACLAAARRRPGCAVLEPADPATNLRRMRGFEFGLCPQGNGFDTHRFWEALACRCVPVVADCAWVRVLLFHFPALPVVVLPGDWDLLPDFVLPPYSAFRDRWQEADRLLDVGYWRGRIEGQRLHQDAGKQPDRSTQEVDGQLVAVASARVTAPNDDYAETLLHPSGRQGGNGHPFGGNPKGEGRGESEVGKGEGSNRGGAAPLLVSAGVFQECLLDNVAQLLALGHGRIVVVVNAMFFGRVVARFGFDNRIQLVAAERVAEMDEADLRGHARMRLDREFRAQFWCLTSSRFFYVYYAMRMLGLDRVVHLENDVLVYHHVGLLADLCDKIATAREESPIWVPFDSPDRNIASVVYVPTAASLRAVLERYDFGRDDMHNLVAIHHATEGRLVRGLPIMEKETGPPGLEFVTRDFPRFGGLIFDAAAMGQFLGGVDPRNHPTNDHNSEGFVNETCVVKYDRYAFEWAGGRPFLRVAPHRRLPIFNLHVHSKNLAPFLVGSDTSPRPLPIRTTASNGRLGNQIIRNVAVSLIAERHGLAASYSSRDAIVDRLGIPLYESGTLRFFNQRELDDENFGRMLAAPPGSVRFRLDADRAYFQTPEVCERVLALLASEAVRGSVQARCAQHGISIVVHVRLGDVPQFSPGLDYFVKAVEGLSPGEGDIAIATDSPDHGTVRGLLARFPGRARLVRPELDEVDTLLLAAAPDLDGLVLSGGSYSALLGYLFRGPPGRVVYPAADSALQWHGDGLFGAGRRIGWGRV